MHEGASECLIFFEREIREKKLMGLRTSIITSVARITGLFYSLNIVSPFKTAKMHCINE